MGKSFFSLPGEIKGMKLIAITASVPTNWPNRKISGQKVFRGEASSHGGYDLRLAPLPLHLWPQDLEGHGP